MVPKGAIQKNVLGLKSIPSRSSSNHNRTVLSNSAVSHTVLQNYSGSFVAVDFETADYGRDSACSVALVRVEGNTIVDKAYSLIRPPRRGFLFTYLHGISWKHVSKKPTFGELWPQLATYLEDAEFLVAHNASFDRSVLKACCLAAGLNLPKLSFRCTVRLARQIWRIHPTKLPNVCAYLGIPLKHHDAMSDAEACAKIVIAARQQVEYDKH